MSFNPDRFTSRPKIEGTFGVVATTHWIASAVGMGVLERGGNAFDAAVAAAFSLQIVEPHLNGPGSDAPIMLHDAKRGRTEVICGQGPAPSGATIAYYRDLGLDLVPGTGLLAPCVPGTFDAFLLLLRNYGTMSLEEVLAGHLLRGSRPPFVGARVPDHCDGAGSVPSSLADFGCSLARSRRDTPARRDVSKSRFGLDLSARGPRGFGSARSRSSNRARPKNLVRRLHCRSGRPLLPHTRDRGRLRPRPSRRADRRGHGGLVRDDRGAYRLRLRPLSRSEAGPLASGSCHFAAVLAA